METKVVLSEIAPMDTKDEVFVLDAEVDTSGDMEVTTQCGRQFTVRRALLLKYSNLIKSQEIAGGAKMPTFQLPSIRGVVLQKVVRLMELLEVSPRLTDLSLAAPTNLKAKTLDQLFVEKDVYDFMKAETSFAVELLNACNYIDFKQGLYVMCARCALDIKGVPCSDIPTALRVFAASMLVK